MYELNCIKNNLKTNYMGRTIIQYDNLLSTFDKAKDISKTCPEGTVILAESQNKCELRYKKEWISYINEGIFMSIIIKPTEKNLNLSTFDMICLASIFDTMSNYNIMSSVKWPNDILVNDKKIASVFSCYSNKRNMQNGIILSIYINVNINSILDSDINATSMNFILNKQLDRELIISDILNNLELYYNEVKNSSTSLSAINICSSNLKKDPIKICKYGKKTIREVKISTLHDNGDLIVINNSNEKEILNAGEIVIINEK